MFAYGFDTNVCNKTQGLMLLPGELTLLLLFYCADGNVLMGKLIQQLPKPRQFVRLDRTCVEFGLQSLWYCISMQ